MSLYLVSSVAVMHRPRMAGMRPARICRSDGSALWGRPVDTDEHVCGWFGHSDVHDGYGEYHPGLRAMLWVGERIGSAPSPMLGTPWPVDLRAALVALAPLLAREWTVQARDGRWHAAGGASCDDPWRGLLVRILPTDGSRTISTLQLHPNGECFVDATGALDGMRVVAEATAE